MKTSVKSIIVIGVLVGYGVFGLVLANRIFFKDSRQEALYQFEIDAVRVADAKAPEAKTYAEMTKESQMIIASASIPNNCKSFFDGVISNANETDSAIGDLFAYKEIHDQLHEDCK